MMLFAWATCWYFVQIKEKITGFCFWLSWFIPQCWLIELQPFYTESELRDHLFQSYCSIVKKTDTLKAIGNLNSFNSIMARLVYYKFLVFLNFIFSLRNQNHFILRRQNFILRHGFSALFSKEKIILS